MFLSITRLKITFINYCQSLEVIVRSVRSINTMSGKRKFAVVVSSDVEQYPQVCDALGVENKEVCYVHSPGSKKSGKAINFCQECMHVYNYLPAQHCY